MPISKYNTYFGGKEGSAEKAYSAMSKEYGKEKGKSVFYALINSKKKKKNKSGLADHMTSLRKQGHFK